MSTTLLKAFQRKDPPLLPSGVHNKGKAVKWSDVIQLYLHPDGRIMGLVNTDNLLLPTGLEVTLIARGIDMSNVTTVAFTPDKKAFIFTYYDSNRTDLSPSVVGIAPLDVSGVEYVYPPGFTDNRFGFKLNANGGREQTIKVDAKDNTYTLHIPDQELDGTMIPLNYTAIVTLG